MAIQLVANELSTTDNAAIENPNFLGMVKIRMKASTENRMLPFNIIESPKNSTSWVLCFYLQSKSNK